MDMTEKEMILKIAKLTSALALATGALRALEPQNPQLALIRRLGERTLFGETSDPKGDT